MGHGGNCVVGHTTHHHGGGVKVDTGRSTTAVKGGGCGGGGLSGNGLTDRPIEQGLHMFFRRR